MISKLYLSFTGWTITHIMKFLQNGVAILHLPLKERKTDVVIWIFFEFTHFHHKYKRKANILIAKKKKESFIW
jgi:hypothetical protein